MSTRRRRPASQYRWRQFSTHISPVSNYNPVDVAQQTHKDSGVPIESAGLALDSKFQTQGYVSPHFAPTPRVPLSPVPAEHPDWKKLDGGELLGEDKVAKSGLLKTVVDVVKAIPFLNKITNSPSTASPHRLEDRPQTFMPEVDVSLLWRAAHPRPARRLLPRLLLLLLSPPVSTDLFDRSVGFHFVPSSRLPLFSFRTRSSTPRPRWR